MSSEQPTSSASTGLTTTTMPVASSASRLGELDDDALGDVADALLETSRLRVIGYGVPVLGVVLSMAVGLLGGDMIARVGALASVATMVVSLFAVPLIGQRQLRRALRDRGLDPRLALPAMLAMTGAPQAGPARPHVLASLRHAAKR